MGSYRNITRTAELMKAMNCYNTEYFDDRVLIQKKLYLAYRCGIANEYEFIWGARGVYCPALNLDSSTILNHDPKYLLRYRLTKKELAIAEYVNSLEDIIEEKELNVGELAWYEMLANIAYLPSQKMEKDSIIDTLKSDDPELAPEDTKVAYKTFNKGKLKNAFNA